MSSMFGGMGGQGFGGSLAGIMPGIGFGGGSLGSLGSLGSFGGGNFSSGMSPMMASMGRANSLGRLSVPAGWTGSTEYASPLRPLSNSGVAATPFVSEQPEAFGSGNMARPSMGMMPMAGMSGGGTSSSHYGTQIKVTGRRKF
jgi:hypothetical protein